MPKSSRTGGALDDILILDLSRVLAAPYCSMMLADLGAEVIKVEAPERGDDSRQWGPPFVGGESAYYLAVNRGKKSITVNLKSEQGREVIRQLAARADVVLENFHVGTMDAWGLGYETLRASNPGLIYCAITGYGQTGPYRDRPGYDFVIQAQGGIMSVTGEVDGPPCKLGVAIVDVTAGQYATIAILAALHERGRSGIGQYIDIALLDSELAWLVNVASSYLVSGEQPQRYGNAHASIVPYQSFQASDGWIVVAVGNDRQWQRLCRSAGWDDLAADARLATNPGRVAERDWLIPLLQKHFSQRTIKEWETKLLQAGVPCTPINAIDDILADPQVLARGMRTELRHPTAGVLPVVGSPLRLSRNPPQLKVPPPLLGEHTAEVLAEHLGYSVADVEELHSHGAI